MKHLINQIFCKAMYLPVVLMVMMVVASCDHEQLPSAPQQQIVVEGWIEDRNFPIVILTKSFPLSSKFQQMDSLGKYLIRWAKVTVSDGKDTVVLTGTRDDAYFPPYIYTTARMMGKAGGTYTLTVDWEDYHATATTTIPSRPQVDSFVVARCADSDSLYQIKVCFNDPQDEKNYYQLFTRVGSKNRQYQAPYQSSISDELLSRHAEVSAYRPVKLGGGEYTAFYTVHDSVAVKLSQVDEASYHFWYDYTKNISFSNNLFLSASTNVRSNIKGGLGYWCGMGSVAKYFIIADYAK